VAVVRKIPCVVQAVTDHGGTMYDRAYVATTWAPPAMASAMVVETPSGVDRLARCRRVGMIWSHPQICQGEPY
jgi:hypothetical protein